MQLLNQQTAPPQQQQQQQQQQLTQLVDLRSAGKKETRVISQTSEKKKKQVILSADVCTLRIHSDSFFRPPTNGVRKDCFFFGGRSARLRFPDTWWFLILFYF